MHYHLRPRRPLGCQGHRAGLTLLVRCTLDLGRQIAVRLFGRAQLANVVPTIAARQRKLDYARGHIALNPARVKSLQLGAVAE